MTSSIYVCPLIPYNQPLGLAPSRLSLPELSLLQRLAGISRVSEGSLATAKRLKKAAAEAAVKEFALTGSTKPFLAAGLICQPYHTMSTPTSIARTAPIAIAAKPSKGRPEITGKENIKPKVSASMSNLVREAPPTRTRKERPCDACRKRKSRCVMHEGQSACVLCQFHSQDCTFVQSPQPRKRKLNGDGKEGSATKRR